MPLSVLTYGTDRYLPTRCGMADTSAEQLLIAARLYDVPLPALDESELARRLSAYARDHSPSTTNSKRRAILTLWDAAAADGLCRPPNRKKVPRAREYKRMPLAWTVAEVERLVAHCRRLSGSYGDVAQGSFWTALVLFVWDTGARVGATLSARSADCNLAERYLILRAEYSKTGVDRVHWLSDQTVAAIAGFHCPHRALIWPWPHHRRTLYRHFRYIVEDVGLKAESTMGLFHKLRRTNLSYTAACGGIELAQRQAGHASSATTRAHYIDPRIAPERSAVDVLPTLNVADGNGERQLRLF